METMELNVPVRKSDADRSARQQVVSSRRSHMTLHMTARRDAVHLPYLSPLLRFAYRGFDVSVIWNSHRSCVSTYTFLKMDWSCWIVHWNSYDSYTHYVYFLYAYCIYAFINIFHQTDNKINLIKNLFLIFIQFEIAITECIKNVSKL